MVIDFNGSTDIYVQNLKDIFESLVERRSYAILSRVMCRDPESALEHYDILADMDKQLAQNLSPHFTAVSCLLLDDAEIKNRLALAAILPQTMRAFDEKMEALQQKLQKPALYISTVI